MQSNSINSNFEQHAHLDSYGIGISVLCALHCLAAPLVFVVAPAFTNSFESDWVHIFLFLVVTGIAGFLFGRHYRVHRSNKVLYFAGTGLILLLAGMIVGHEFGSRPMERIFSVFGSLFLVAAHFYNIRACRCARNSEKCSYSEPVATALPL